MFEKLRGALDSAITKATTRELNEKNLADAVWELQMVLIQNDVAVEVAEHICELTKKKVLGTRAGRLENLSRLFKSAIYDSILEVLTPEHPLDPIEFAREKREKGETTTILFVGVNGTGKTTTLAKLANIFKKKGFSVVIAAGDTYRAGSIEQLEKHAERLGVRVIRQDYGADAAAIAYDAVAHAKARHIDIVLIDSAGRMQSNKNLLEEMKKIVRVAEPDLKIFVGDALAGNDALSQAKEFHNAIGIDGAILAKVDADPSGGAALSIAFVTGRPVVYVGVGQYYDDLKRFDPSWFAERLIAEN
ncbi:MAG: signal recognition particle-docking protein FtsY [Candidatus Thorarchaeota archaeon SMTZ1-45]|nr:MAG: signal recognition particle-docking protein FtsY [Candidatus Thorarchaeota archaeon SMTZ1-45]